MAVSSLECVGVADRGSAEGSTSFGFFTHFVGNVCAVACGAIFVDGREESVGELTNGRGVDVFGGADESDTVCGQFSDDMDIVGSVARKPGQFVDDEVSDTCIRPDSFEELLKYRSLGDGAAGAAWFDVLIDDGEIGLLCSSATGITLGGDRKSFWPDVRP